MKRSFSYPSVLLFLFIMSINTLFFSGHIGGDARFTYFTAESIFTDGNLDIADSISRKELGPLTESFDEVVRYAQERAAAGEKVYSKYDLGSTIVGVIFYGIGFGITKIFPFLPKDYILIFIFSLSNVFIVALCALYFYKIADLFIPNKRLSALLSTGLVFSTVLFPYTVKSGFGEPLSCLAVTASLYYALLYEKNRKIGILLLSGLYAGLLFITKPYSVLALPGLGILIFFTIKKTDPSKTALTGRFIEYGLSYAPGIILFLWYNYIRFGSIFNTGYGGTISHFFSAYSFLFTAYEIFFSPGKGIFLFNPLVVIGLAGIFPLYRANKPLFACYCITITLFIAYFAGTGFWIAGISWGVRYFVPILTVLILPVIFFIKSAIEQQRNGRIRLVAIAFIIGIIIQLPSVLINYSSFDRYLETESGHSIYTRVGLARYSPVLCGYYLVYSGIKRAITGESAKFPFQYSDASTVERELSIHPDAIRLFDRIIVWKSLAGYDRFDIWLANLWVVTPGLSGAVKSFGIMIFSLLLLSAYILGIRIFKKSAT